MHLSDEVWKAVVGYEGYYEVSNCGNVRSVDHEVKSQRWHEDGTRAVKGKVIRPALTGSKRNYLCVHLSKDGVITTELVHRLVARAFVSGYEPHLTVDHLNGNTFDNRADNLCWCTQAENNRRAIELGLASPAKMIAHCQTKQFRDMMSNAKRKPVIRDDGQVFSSARAASTALGLDVAAVSAHIRGRRHRVGGHTFRYLTPEERVKYSI